MDPSDRDTILAAFPGLRGIPWHITSPATEHYNCVAWAAADAERWWWPAASYFWPSAAPWEASIPAFTTAFISLGYELCVDASHEADYLKVALFANDYGPSHAARELANGDWTSKLGSFVDITHPLTALEGATYGRVVQVLKRPTLRGNARQ